MKELIKNTFIMLAIAVVAGGILGYVYNSTKDIISLQENEKEMEAYAEVFANTKSFDRAPDIDEAIKEQLINDGYDKADIDKVVYAKDNDGRVIGYVFVITTHEGFSGDITFAMGVSSDGTLMGISILSISETAGLGMEAPKVLVPQFKDKKAVKFTYTKTGASNEDEIDAISGATITTNAITNGVNLGLHYFIDVLGGCEIE